MAGVLGQTSGPEPKDGISNADVHAELVRQGIEVSLKTVDKWRRISGMPSRDPERLNWIKRNRPKWVTEETVATFTPKQGKAIQASDLNYREQRLKWAAIGEQFKARRQRQLYDVERGRLIPAKLFMGILRQHIRTARLILLGIPNAVSSHLSDKAEQAEIRIATAGICEEVAKQIVFAVEEACDEAGITITLHDDSRANSTIPVDEATEEDAAT